MYDGETSDELEMGLLGVASTHLDSHREITLTMLAHAITQARAAGVRRLRAEIDSDDPWTLYACAELPFVRGKQSVGLVFMPKWRGDKIEP